MQYIVLSARLVDANAQNTRKLPEEKIPEGAHYGLNFEGEYVWELGSNHVPLQRYSDAGYKIVDIRFDGNRNTFMMTLGNKRL